MSRQGSSPRGRGKLACIIARARAIGLIPAWAGKTSLRTPPPERSQAHPRVGGENFVATMYGLGLRGSSPRGRGKPAAPADREFEGRLIPAWAGKTTSTDPTPSSVTAHPRVGGENPRLIPP